MSQENEELIRRWFWAFTHDRTAFQATFHPEVEWRPFEEGHSPSHGLQGAMRIRDNWIATWDEHRVEVEEIVQGQDALLGTVHVTARGAASGVEVDVRLHFQFAVRDGKIVYVYEHDDRDEALEAVGLSE